MTDAVLAPDAEKAKHFWALREAASESLPNRNPGCAVYKYDISLPID